MNTSTGGEESARMTTAALDNTQSHAGETSLLRNFGAIETNTHLTLPGSIDDVK